MKKNTTIIIDGYGFVFRAYHSLPPLTDPSGNPVGALYGFTNMLLKVVNDFKPSHAVIVFDSGKTTFRHEIYKEYKANRPPAPDDLISQFPLMREAAAALNFHVIEKEGFEADDIIATLANQANENNEQAIIVSSDKDLMQLVNGEIIMYDSLRAKFIRREQVVEKYGVPPENMLDLLAMMGDSSDNIPGIPGIGLKTAAELIKQYGNLENILENAENIPQKKRRQTIIDHKEQALLSKKLVSLDMNVPFDLKFTDLLHRDASPEALVEFCHKFGFKSLLTKAQKILNITLPEIILQQQQQVNITNIVIKENNELKQIKELIDKYGQIFFDIVHDKQKISAASILIHDKLFHIPIKHNSEKEAQNYSLLDEEQQESLISQQDFVDFFKPILKDSAIHKILYNLKDILHLFNLSDFIENLGAFDDLLLMHYLLTAGGETQTIPQMLRSFADCEISSPELIVKEDRKLKTIFDIPREILQNYHEQLLPAFAKIWTITLDKMRNQKLLSLYRDCEIHMAYVLYEMEQHGVKIDCQILKEMSQKFSQELISLERKIYDVSGCEFNIASSKQLGEVLFDKMGILGGKISAKSKTYSTGADILEELSVQGYEIADLILKYRQISKLKNTYTDALPKLLNPLTNRVHTTFIQNATSTGRLSSHEPNLQNIPIRSEYGTEIRKAFIVPQGYKLISADYSQIELRILSHMADIDSLKQAFAAGRDIHAQTAQDVFSLSPEQVNSEYRRKAKAINFGILYGLSSFGLAKQLGISRTDASYYIEQYFHKYPGIEQYMNSTKEYAKKHGYVCTLFGRYCFLKGINDKNYAIRSFNERAAINAPLQGTVADLMKFAMIDLVKLFKKNNLKSRLILQVHDEILIESPEEELAQAQNLIKQAMQNVTQLSVPLQVDLSVQNNWSKI